MSDPGSGGASASGAPRRVLVTGASGFLGQVLVPRLVAAGWQVVALGHSQGASPFPEEVEYRRLDLLDPGAVEDGLRGWGFDAVAHLAGPVAKDNASAADAWAQTFPLARAHLLAAQHLLGAIPAGWRGAFVHASSMVVYGPPGDLPIPEDRPLRPGFAYAIAKALADEAVQAACRGRAFTPWILRLPGLFSAGRAGGALFHFSRAALAGEPLKVSADRPTPWELLDVEDAAEGVLRALAGGPDGPGPINLGYGEPIELTAVARDVVRRLGVEVPVEVREGVEHPPFQLDISRAAERLAWPPRSLGEALDAYLQARRAQLAGGAS